MLSIEEMTDLLENPSKDKFIRFIPSLANDIENKERVSVGCVSEMIKEEYRRIICDNFRGKCKSCPAYSGNIKGGIKMSVGPFSNINKSVFYIFRFLTLHLEDMLLKEIYDEVRQTLVRKLLNGNLEGDIDYNMDIEIFKIRKRTNSFVRLMNDVVTIEDKKMIIEILAEKIL